MRAAPKREARLTGALYLVIMAAALYTEIAVRGALIVGGDAAATARNILGAEPLFRLGIVLDVVTYVCDVAVAALLFVLTKPAGMGLALTAAAFRLVYSAMAGVLCFLSFSALAVLHGGGLGALTSDQQQAIAYSQLKLRDVGFVIALIFFAAHLLLLGALLIKSRYLPAWIGVLLVLAGAGYLINSLADLLAPTVSLGPWLLLPGLVGEGALTLWLLIVGLNAKKWQERVAV